MLQLHPTNRNAGYCCTGSMGMSVQVTSGQCACLFYFLLTSFPSIIATGSADIFTIMFNYVALEQYTYLKPSRYVCNSFTRLADMLQYPCFNHCICKSCIYQQICLNQLQLTYKHICSCVAEPAAIYVTLASDPQLCPYARTRLTGW